VNKLSKLALALGIALAVPSAAFAATTSHVAVSASVSNTCNIYDATLAFGTYDGLNTNAATNIDQTAALTYKCNNKTVPSIGLDTGANAANHTTGTTRAMSDGASDFLGYELYTNTAHTTVWGNAIGSWFTQPAVPSNSLQTATIYGRIPSAQDAPTGSYTDSVLATINF
jgi:spore coat protein U-like protein